MTWSAEESEAFPTEAGTGVGTVTSWIEILPREVIHCTVVRTDAGTANWQIRVQGSTDGARVPSSPNSSLIIAGANKTIEFPVLGRRYFRIRCVSTSPDVGFDGTLYWTRDGGT